MKRIFFLVSVLFLNVLWFGQADAYVEIKPLSPIKIKEGEMFQRVIEAASDDGPVIFDAIGLPLGAQLKNQRQIGEQIFACDLVWQPSYEQAGSYIIVIIAKDKTSEDQFILSVEVKDVNRPPGEPLQPHPADGESVYYDDKLILSWDGERRDEDGDEVEFLVEVWKQGPKKNPLISAYTKDIFYEITIILPATNYMWRVTAIDEHGTEKKSPIWKFTVSQWFKINIDSTVFVLFVRKPGEYTLKWTNVKIQSNGDLGLCFKPVDAEGPNGEKIQIIYGIKEADDIIWHNESWVMKIDLPETGYTFELYAKVKIEPKHSSGLYKGKLGLNVAMLNQGGEE